MRRARRGHAPQGAHRFEPNLGVVIGDASGEQFERVAQTRVPGTHHAHGSGAHAVIAGIEKGGKQPGIDLVEVW